MNPHTPQELQKIYAQRFNKNKEYRVRVWKVIIDSFLSNHIDKSATVLDLGCGYGEFINNVDAQKKYAMDLNPNVSDYLNPEVELFEQDCSSEWPLDDNSLDVIFTSNFFEHLPDKKTLGETLDQAYRCLKQNGILIAIGPNIRFLAGEYWDFWDHYLPLTEISLSEALINRDYIIENSWSRFLPYTMVGKKEIPAALIRIYLHAKLAWKFFGKQFLVIARKPAN